jgi:hypothetical protein
MCEREPPSEEVDVLDCVILLGLKMLHTDQVRSAIVLDDLPTARAHEYKHNRPAHMHKCMKAYGRKHIQAHIMKSDAFFRKDIQQFARKDTHTNTHTRARARTHTHTLADEPISHIFNSRF